MKARSYIWLLLAIIVVFAAGTLPMQQKPADSMQNYLVLGMTGEWKTASAPAKAEFLQFGDVLKPEAGKNGVCVEGNQDGSLVVWFQEGTVSYACSGQQDANCGAARTNRRCARWVAQPAKQQEKQNASFAAYLLALIAPRFVLERDQLVVAASRGLEPELNEAVVALRGAQVDVSPAFREMEPGQYTLRFTTVIRARSNSGESATPAFQVRYTKGIPVMVPGSGLKPGLYNLGATATTGESAGEAWVLIAATENYERLSSAFQQAVEVTQKWPEEVDPRANRSVLRAYLQALAEQK